MPEKTDDRLKAAQDAKDAQQDAVAEPNKGPVGEYTVIAAGVSYQGTEADAPILLGLHHRVIRLHEAEARRLLSLGAIRAADDADKAAEVVFREQELRDRAIGPVDSETGNPFGGTPLKSLEEHAAEEIAKATKAAKG